MPDMPRHLFALDLSDGALLLLAALYGFADADEHAAHLRGQGEPAFVWPTWPQLQACRNKARSTIAAQLALLTEAGEIRRASRTVAQLPARARAAFARRGEDFKVLGYELTPSGLPDRLAARTVKASGSSDPHRPDPRTQTVQIPGPPPSHTLPSPKPPNEPTTTTTEPEGASGGAAEPDDISRKLKNGQAGRGPAPTSTRVTAQRPIAAAPGNSDAVVGCDSLVRALLVDATVMFCPVDAQGRAVDGRRIRQDRPTLERLERLLTPPEMIDDAGAWRKEQVAFVRRYLEAYAGLCQAEAERLRAAGGAWKIEETTYIRWWGGLIFECRPKAGKTAAPWDMVVRAVDAAGEAAASAAASRDAAVAKAAQVTRALERDNSPAAVAERLERARRMEAEVQALGLRKSTVDAPAPRGEALGEALDEAAELSRGRWAESDQERAEAREDEKRRQLVAALVKARQVKGSELTRDEADHIRQAMG